MWRHRPNGQPCPKERLGSDLEKHHAPRGAGLRLAGAVRPNGVRDSTRPLLESAAVGSQDERGVFRRCGAALVLAVLLLGASLCLGESSRAQGHTIQRRPAKAAASTITPDLFRDVSSGVARVQVRQCGGGAGTGTGFLIGNRVVMTARHVVRDACSVRVIIAGRSYGASRVFEWSTTGRRDLEAADVATFKLSRPAPGYVFSFARNTPKPRTTIAVIGFPLGNPLSLNQGPLVYSRRIQGLPLIGVRIATAKGSSGSAFLNPAGDVIGILQRGMVVGPGEGGVVSPADGLVVGINLVRWWGPQIIRDLCKAYPTGRIPGCNESAPSAACVRRDRTYSRRLDGPWNRYVTRWNMWVDSGSPPDSSFWPTLDALYELVVANRLLDDLPCSRAANRAWTLIDQLEPELDEIRQFLNQMDALGPYDYAAWDQLSSAIGSATQALLGRLTVVYEELELLDGG
jgi:S1-C subfamily serine protease